VAAGDWTFLGGSAFDSGFRHNLVDIKQIRKPKQESAGLRYIVIQLSDGCILPSLHFSPGGVERVEAALQSFFTVKEISPGVCQLEAIKKPKARLSIWEDDEDDQFQAPVTGKQILNQTFGLFSKITKAIHENLVDDSIDEQRIPSPVRSQPELNRERPIVVRCEPVTLETFESMLSQKQWKSIKSAIFKGGLTAEARPDAWKKLLGVDTLTDMEEKYINLRSQWEKLTPEQESLCSLLRERRNLIAKDVIRTEPTRLTEPEIKRLQELLTTYCIFDQDLGYVQGMSDIAVVVLDWFSDDCEAFWVYTRIMQRIRANFEKSQKAIKQQFEALRRILAFTDGDMIRFLDERDSGHMYFTFPWFLIIFRRLSSWEELPTLWDSWLTSPCSNFHLLIAAAILDLHRDELMRPEFGYCEILQFVNRLNGKIPIDDLLARSESLLVQIQNCISTPPVVKQLLDI